MSDAKANGKALTGNGRKAYCNLIMIFTTKVNSEMNNIAWSHQIIESYPT
jgi:hypothetical protein